MATVIKTGGDGTSDEYAMAEYPRNGLILKVGCAARDVEGVYLHARCLHGIPSLALRINQPTWLRFRS
jgi:hypothetical protein